MNREHKAATVSGYALERMNNFIESNTTWHDESKRQHIRLGLPS